MEFWNIVIGLLRRKLVATLLIVFPLTAALVAFFLVPARYTASSFIVLTTSATGELLPQDPNKKGALTNPLLEFNDGLRTTSAILISALTTPQVLTQLGAPPEGNTELTIDDGRSSDVLLQLGGPFVYIEVDATSAAKAEKVVKDTRERVRGELHKRQVALGAPAATYISAVDVIPPTMAKQSLANKAQATGTVLVTAFLCLFGAVYARERSRIAKAARGDAALPAGAVRAPEPEERRPAPESAPVGSGAAPEPPTGAPGPPAEAPEPAEVPEPAEHEGRPEPVGAAAEAGPAGFAETTAEVRIPRPAASPEPAKHEEPYRPPEPDLDDDSITAVFPVIVIDDPAENVNGQVESSPGKSG
ncbi:hypothetical protein [Planomonospora venezuelensis]|uniref:Capsular polysaccharide biosynthesis protein n=1 Tax=Planomonospora venezuelensis TaxID=1999 RepID=A0A841D159_PLAVE|nr:hypothetical protein [Planomonospora venezuelensis]MBB5961266.1 hypothetical protein [Planomonospora venezuelensis]GIM99940.1 hypothetical protein Pve01_15990 [Planomonospora venezuelensis]